MNKNKTLKLISGVLAGLILAESAAFASNGANANDVIQDVIHKRSADRVTVAGENEKYKGHPLFEMARNDSDLVDNAIKKEDIALAIRYIQDIRRTVLHFARQGDEALLPYIAGINNTNYISKPVYEKEIPIDYSKLNLGLSAKESDEIRYVLISTQFIEKIINEDIQGALLSLTQLIEIRGRYAQQEEVRDRLSRYKDEVFRLTSKIILFKAAFCAPNPMPYINRIPWEIPKEQSYKDYIAWQVGQNIIIYEDFLMRWMILEETGVIHSALCEAAAAAVGTGLISALLTFILPVVGAFLIAAVASGAIIGGMALGLSLYQKATVLDSDHERNLKLSKEAINKATEIFIWDHTRVPAFVQQIIIGALYQN